MYFIFILTLINLLNNCCFLFLCVYAPANKIYIFLNLYQKIQIKPIKTLLILNTPVNETWFVLNLNKYSTKSKKIDNIWKN